MVHARVPQPRAQRLGTDHELVPLNQLLRRQRPHAAAHTPSALGLDRRWDLLVEWRPPPTMRLALGRLHLRHLLSIV